MQGKSSIRLIVKKNSLLTRYEYNLITLPECIQNRLDLKERYENLVVVLPEHLVYTIKEKIKNKEEIKLVFA